MPVIEDLWDLSYYSDLLKREELLLDDEKVKDVIFSLLRGWSLSECRNMDGLKASPLLILGRDQCWPCLTYPILACLCFLCF